MTNAWLRAGDPLRIAHRGHITTLPEQTMVAFRAAISAGAQMIEADVQRTRDGVLVMLHDETLDRTTDGHGPVADRTWAEVAALDAGAWFGPEGHGARVPALDELLDLADASGVGLCLEAKGATDTESRAIAREVARVLQRRGALDRHVLASFDHEALRAARADVPGLIVAPDRLPERGRSDPEALVAQAVDLGAPILQHHHADLDRAGVAALHAAGIAIWAWPVNDAASVARARALGVDGVMGDDVPLLAGPVSAAS